jgi:hypothetical protein
MNAMINSAMQLFYDELDRRELAGIQARKVLDAQQAAADARDAEEARQAKVDTVHGEGLADNATWDAATFYRLGAEKIEAAHAAALIDNAAYNAETARLFAAIPIVMIATVPALDVAMLADSAGDEPATDAEIIAELVAALRDCADYLYDISVSIHNPELEKARAAIGRAEGRAA